jgi:hypothetical protein
MPPLYGGSHGSAQCGGFARVAAANICVLTEFAQVARWTDQPCARTPVASELIGDAPVAAQVLAWPSSRDREW